MKRTLSLLLLGLASLAAALLVVRWSGNRAARLQIQVSDWAVVRADGLRLGARPASRDIALVLLDVETAAKQGYLRSFEDDIRLYRQLLEAGASVVYDSRMIAAADPSAFAEFQSMLDQMLELDSSGRLMRDVLLSPTLHTETQGHYDVLFAPNVARTQPHQIASQRSRLYPLFQVSGEELVESAPLRIGRRALQIEKTTSAEIAEQMKQCGIITAWHVQAPQMIPESDVPPSPYRFGSQPIVWYPFTTSTSLVPPAGFWVSYDPAVSDYQSFSLGRVLETTDDADFRDRIVIIGVSASPEILDDPYEVPSKVGNGTPAEVIAAAVQTLLDQRMMREPPGWWNVGCIAFLCIVLAQVCGWLRPLYAILASVALLFAYLGAATMAYRMGWFADFAITPLFGLLSGFLGFVYSASASIRSRQRVVELFGRYVPRAVVNQLMLKPELQRLTLGGIRRDVSVLFADIRGFTSFSEDLDPEEVVRQLNSLLEIMVQCTFENEGTLDKFIGDAILVLFNAPLDQGDHVSRAVRTATAIQQRLEGHSTGLRVGIGVHRGDAVVGNIGTHQRLEYTAIGSTVNIASRLCSLAQPGEVILSSAMLDGLPESVVTESLGPVSVKGIKQSLEAHRVVLATGLA